MDKINTVQEIFAVFVSHTNIEKTVYLLFAVENLLQRNFNMWKPKYDGHKSNYKKNGISKEFKKVKLPWTITTLM